MSVQTKIENYLNYITGSAGGWPSNTHIGIVGGLDYIIEETTNDVYFNEMNTNIGMYGPFSQQSASFNLISDYVNEKGCNTAYIYGCTYSDKQNPSVFQQPLISESFARHGISVNFEYQDNTSITYFSQRGQSQYTGSFHLFIGTPWYSDDNLLSIVSGSFNKSTFRNLLSSSPESASLIPLFDKDNYTHNPNFPDYVIKNPTGHSTLESGEFGIKKYLADTTTYQDAVDSGYITEKFVIPSGSYQNGKSYIFTSKSYYLLTPEKLINLENHTGKPRNLANHIEMSGSESWFTHSSGLRSTASGSLINMYDGTTKQVQDVEVGDVILSYQPLGMPDESEGQGWSNFTTSDLSGSFTSGSIVVDVFSGDSYGYYLINGSIKIQGQGVKYFVKSSGTWQWKQPSNIVVGDYFLDKDGNDIEITSKTDVIEQETFYGLNVEDIDTYFQSNILVHNIPPKCFVSGTPITMGDGTTKSIELIEVGDEVRNYDFDTEEIKTGKVLAIKTPMHADIIEISFGDKKTKNTFDHPYWVVGKGWSSYKPQWTEKRYSIDSKQLEIGDICLELYEGKLREIEITNIIEDINPVQTYSLEIETNHNYFANDILVHNKFICLMADQVINMGDGVYKRIDEIELGENILVYDEENDEFKEGKVNTIMKKLHSNCYELKVESGQVIKPTGNHPFLLRDKGWSTIEKNNPTFEAGGGVIEVGDYVKDLDGWVEIVEINKIDGEHITYNLLNQDYGTIVAHDIVTHNSP